MPRKGRTSQEDKKKKQEKEDKDYWNERNSEVRVPRPLGHTYLAINLNQEQNKELKQKLKSNIIDITIDRIVESNMYYNGKMVTINHLANYLNTNTIDIIKRMNRGVNRMAKLFGEEGHEIARVTILGTLKMALDGYHIAQNQAHILMAQQGDRYVPFMTNAVNQAIKTQIDATKPILEVIKAISPASPLITNELHTHNHTHITADEAVKLLQGNQISMLEDSTQLTRIDALNGIPEVNGRYQESTEKALQYSLSNPNEESNTGFSADLKLPEKHNRAIRSGYEEVEDEDEFIM